MCPDNTEVHELHYLQDQNAPQEGIGIDYMLNAVTTIAPAASMED